MAINTELDGFFFHSLLEMRWMQFFNECGADWEYRPGVFVTKNRLGYGPDFRLRNVRIRDMDTNIIIPEFFVDIGLMEDDKPSCNFKILKGMPDNEEHPFFYSITVRKFPEEGMPYLKEMSGRRVMLGVDKKGTFTVFRSSRGYLRYMDRKRTMAAYDIARQARFSDIERY